MWAVQMCRNKICIVSGKAKGNKAATKDMVSLLEVECKQLRNIGWANCLYMSVRVADRSNVDHCKPVRSI